MIKASRSTLAWPETASRRREFECPPYDGAERDTAEQLTRIRHRKG